MTDSPMARLPALRDAGRLLRRRWLPHRERIRGALYTRVVLPSCLIPAPFLAHAGNRYG
jgi:hypothetical protein